MYFWNLHIIAFHEEMSCAWAEVFLAERGDAAAAEQDAGPWNEDGAPRGSSRSASSKLQILMKVKLAFFKFLN